jgi:hypothetical protein
MNASAAVNGGLRIPRVGPFFPRIKADGEAAPQCARSAQAESIRNILSQGGYTVAQLSAATRKRYGAGSPFFIPSTFLYKLRSGVTPHVCQVVALSESTGYRFVDWLRLCGFDLQQIPNLQVRLHTERTVLVTPIEDCIESFLPRNSHTDQTAWSSIHALQWGGWSGGGRYLFAKIGASDAQAAYPQLRAGSVVRVDRCYGHRVEKFDSVSREKFLWLVEQPGGLTCSRVRWIDDRQIVLLPSRPPWGSWPLCLRTEARVLGLVETDLNPAELQELHQTEVQPAQREPLSPFPCPEKRIMKFSDLLRSSRGRTGLTFRAAQRLTHTIAQVLGNQEYAIALGLLSDYEAMDRLPRHIAKILSLCMIYCMDMVEVMESAGVCIDDSAKLRLPIPDHRLPLHADYLETVAYYPRTASYPA